MQECAPASQPGPANTCKEAAYSSYPQQQHGYPGPGPGPGPGFPASTPAYSLYRQSGHGGGYSEQYNHSQYPGYGASAYQQEYHR